MLGQCRRRRASIKTSLVQSIAFDGIHAPYFVQGLDHVDSILDIILDNHNAYVRMDLLRVRWEFTVQRVYIQNRNTVSCTFRETLADPF